MVCVVVQLSMQLWCESVLCAAAFMHSSACISVSRSSRKVVFGGRLIFSADRGYRLGGVVHGEYLLGYVFLFWVA